MMWFDKDHPAALYMDKRAEVVKWEADETIPGKDTKKHRARELVIAPDVVADFTAMPFPDESFSLVVFDPPHFNSLGENSRLAKTYGRLVGDWECEIHAGFRECFRVLKVHGTLIFKWNSTDIPLAKILELAEVSPLFGHTTGRQAKTHWVTFLKQNADVDASADTATPKQKPTQ
jgi:SAM-dependent methyltransferase